MQERSTDPGPRSLAGRLARDPWVAGGGVAAIAVALGASLATAPPSRVVAEVLLLPVVIAVFLRRVDRVSGEREQAFWIRLAGAFFFLWLAAALEILPRLGVEEPRVPGAAIDALRLLGLLPVGLAIDLRPHRQDDEAPRLLRQLQLTAVFLTALILSYYLWLGPRWAELAGRLERHEIAALGLLLTVTFAVFALRRRSPRWRLAYALGAVVFLTWTGALLVSSALPVAVATFLSVLWARSRRFELDGAVFEPPAARSLRLELPVVAVLPLIPVLHLTLGVFDLSHGPANELRAWLVLASLAVLAPMAWIEHLLLQKRSTFLELEHRRAADETVERSVYLDSLIEHSPLAIVVLDPYHRVQLINPAFEELFQYRSEEVVGSTLDRLISTDTQRAEASSYTRAVIEGRSVHVTARRRRSDGTELDIELYGVPLMRDDKLIGIFAIYQDVSQRLRAEKALRESEERFRRLSDASFEGIVVSEDGLILDCNEQYAKMMGLEPREVMGRPVLDFVAPVDRRLVERNVRQGLEQPYEHRARRADGSRLVVEVHGRSVPYDGRTVQVAAVRDMTEHKRLEEEMRQAQKMEAVGRLAGGIAHDFNNLLTVIKGYAQLLSMQMEEGKLKALVGEILQASERASLMTQRLLAFGRKQAVQPQDLDLGEILQGMEKILRRLIRADIAFKFVLDERLGSIKADPSQIEQVILNLAINAGDAMPQGGTLRFETARVEVEDGAIHGPVTSPGSYVRLTVGDTGLGMDPATLSQVFEPFFTTKEKGKGTGLGLATVYAIVKQSGGAIDVESEPGHGTTFSIFFPRMLESTGSISTQQSAPDLPRGTETVLVVEDQPGVRALAVEFLQQLGYKVKVARDGRDGLRCFEEQPDDIDLVLTDVVMPEMNGPEMVRKLRQRHPRTKVLYMSGYTDEMLGMDDPAVSSLLVQKPFSVEELVTKVRQVLDGEASEA